jgi:lysophospholipase L1-like esterase
VRRTALRLPEAEGPRDGVAGAGKPAMRVLIVGDSSAAGVGLPDQAQALAMPMAQRLHEARGITVGWQLVAKSGIDSADALEMVRAESLYPADVVVTVLGVNDVTAQRSAAGYTHNIAALWQDLSQRTGAKRAILCGLPPMGLLTAMPQPLRWYLGRYSDWLDDALQRYAASRSLAFCSLRWAADPGLLSHDGFHPGPRLYPPWAQRLAELAA